MSQIISFLRFPLIALVVMIHTDLTDVYFNGEQIVDPEAYPAYHIFRNFLQEVLRMVVPVFFMVSGYLFCPADAQLSGGAYLGKLRSRVRSLLVPYLLWITIVLAVNALGPLLLPSLASGRHGPYELTLAAIVRDYWVHPACIQFWFLRDLMVVCVLSVPLLWLVRRLGLWWLAVLAALYIAEEAMGHPFPAGMGPCAMLFFSAGAWYKMRVHPRVGEKPDSFPFRLSRTSLWGLGSAYLAVVGVATWLHGEVLAVSRLSVLLGLPLVLWLCGRLALDKGWKVPEVAAAATFFVYGSHMFLLAFSERMIVRALPKHDIVFALAYVAVPAIVVVLCVCASGLMRRLLPRTWSLLTGNR